MAMPTDSIAFHARLSPQQLAARDLLLGIEWTYAELDALVGRLAAMLRKRGCVDGSGWPYWRAIRCGKWHCISPAAGLARSMCRSIGG